jgi:triphosphoribosyl-dephospho-CoA synthase
MNVDSTPLTPGQLAQIACLLEATARKPGNVHRFRDFDDTHYLDFLLSAAAIARPLDLAPGTRLGLTILRCVEATRRLVRTNTNLGMILLLAPLASVPIGEDFREGLARILGSTTTEDAALVYQAIRLAKPGGLGKVEDQDVDDEPTVTLQEAMTLAADRDLVARQYANGFAGVFDFALPSLKKSIESGKPVEMAIITAFLEFLSANPDTLIARKCGQGLADKASSRALEVLNSGDWMSDQEGSETFAEFDEWLRADGHARNPGATADLTTAALFAALRDGTIQIPIRGGWSIPA